MYIEGLSIEESVNIPETRLNVGVEKVGSQVINFYVKRKRFEYNLML